jgi:CheY-like chemotaxis protein
MSLSDSAILVRKVEILIIEDSVTSRLFLKRVLEKSLPDCTVHEAADGFQALQALGRMSANLIVSDLQMPRMDGWTFLKTLRSNAIFKKKPVIILSSESTAAQADEMRKDPMLRFLTKPASAEEIARAAVELLATTR